MKTFAILSTLASIAAMASAASVQVNFYSDTGCHNFIGSRFIDYDPSNGGSHHSGGPAGSRGGLYVNSNGDNLAFRGFSNHADGSNPFTGNLQDGQCIGTLNGIVATFVV